MCDHVVFCLCKSASSAVVRGGYGRKEKSCGRLQFPRRDSDLLHGLVKGGIFMNLKEIWKSSALKLKSIKWLAIMAIFLALRIVVAQFSITVATNLTISFSFILVALSGMLFGPVAGMVFAFTEDILQFLLFPSGYGFFFGYTLSAMLGVLCYALFLYGQRITILKILFAKILSSYVVNVLIGSYWTYLMVGSKGYWAYAAVSFYKNTILFPIQIILIIIIINFLLPFFSKKKYITPAQQRPIPFK